MFVAKVRARDRTFLIIGEKVRSALTRNYAHTMCVLNN